MDVKKICGRVLILGVVGFILSIIWAYNDGSFILSGYGFGAFISFLTTGKSGSVTTGATTLFWISVVASAAGFLFKSSSTTSSSEVK
jgi:hypothetical protein